MDEIIKIGGWKMELIATYYIGAISSGKGHGESRGNAARPTLALESCHCRVSFKTISQRVRERTDVKKVWVRQPRA